MFFLGKARQGITRHHRPKMDQKWTNMDQTFTKNLTKWTKVDQIVTKIWPKFTKKIQKKCQKNTKKIPTNQNRQKMIDVRADVRVDVLNPMMFIHCNVINTKVELIHLWCSDCTGNFAHPTLGPFGPLLGAPFGNGTNRQPFYKS